jgi:hypothetical protein
MMMTVRAATAGAGIAAHDRESFMAPWLFCRR